MDAKLKAWLIGLEMTSDQDVMEVTADTLPDDVAAVLALTPHVADDTDWKAREQEAQRMNELAAKEFTDSWDIFVEKPVIYEPDGDVLWMA